MNIDAKKLAEELDHLIYLQRMQSTELAVGTYKMVNFLAVEEQRAKILKLATGKTFRPRKIQRGVF